MMAELYLLLGYLCIKSYKYLNIFVKRCLFPVKREKLDMRNIQWF